MPGGKAGEVEKSQITSMPVLLAQTGCVAAVERNRGLVWWGTRDMTHTLLLCFSPARLRFRRHFRCKSVLQHSLSRHVLVVRLGVGSLLLETYGM